MPKVTGGALSRSEERDFGFAEICAALSGTRFEVRHDGDDCVTIGARLEGGFDAERPGSGCSP